MDFASHEDLCGVGLLLPQSPPYYSDIRFRPRRFVDRLCRRILPHLQPIGQHHAVRGLSIAAENLLECLVLGGGASPYHYQLFAGGEPSRCRKWLDAKRQGPPVRCRVSSIAALARKGSLEGIRLWYEPQANYGLVYEVRDRLADADYPIVSTVHGLGMHTMLYKHFVRILLCDTQAIDSFVCSSAASKQALRNIFSALSENLNQRYGLAREFRGRFDVIPLPLDTDVFRPGDKAAAKRRLGLPSDCALLLYLGLISPLKADLLPCLLALSRRVNELERHNLIFCIAGGADREHLESLMRQAQAVGYPTSRLRIYKDPLDKTKRDLLQAADVFTSPSDSIQEAFGLTLTEALACGVPQVAPNWDGYRDIVRDGVTGLLVPTRWTPCDEELADTGFLLGWAYDHHVLGQTVAMDIDRWRESVLALFDNPDLRNRMSIASRERAITEFSMENVRRQYFDLFRESAQEPARARGVAKRWELERPRYYEWFRHYASDALSSDTVVQRAGDSERLDAIELANMIKPPIHSEVVRSVLRSVGSSPCAVCRIQSDLTPAISSTTVLRHIMWALKYGLLAVAESAQPPCASAPPPKTGASDGTAT